MKALGLHNVISGFWVGYNWEGGGWGGSVSAKRIEANNTIIRVQAQSPNEGRMGRKSVTDKARAEGNSLRILMVMYVTHPLLKTNAQT